MCGVAGYIGRERLDDARVQRTLDLMRNRGPDHRASVKIEGEKFNVWLLHTRLSIIDLDARAHQPFRLDDLTLAYNGEIYNYVELREDLRRRGCAFRTESDTEVLLQAYRTFGSACADRFEGMWAFALHDPRAGQVLLSRDRFAEKPLYYLALPDGVYFASEVKFLRALSGRPLRVNERHLRRYLVNGYKALYKTEETFFEGVREVPSGCHVRVGEDFVPRAERYWRPAVAPKAMSREEAVTGFGEALAESLKIRLRADVPLAFCLSGGVDSAALVSLAAKRFRREVATYSILDTDERYDERANIGATVRDLGCRNRLIEIPREGFFERLRRLVAYHDAPVYTISYYVHSFLSEAIARDGFKVAVSGTAADEMVTGYYDHFNLHLHEIRDRPEFAQALADWERHTRPFVRNPHLQDPRLYFKDPGFRDHIYLNNDVFAGYLKADFAEAFVETRYCDSLLRNRMLNELFQEAIPVILHEDDLNSMLFSLENRSPYLDRRLFEFACSIPPEHLIRDGYGKHVLREAVKGILNDQVRLDRRKRGFNAAVHSLVDFERPENRAAVLAGGKIFDYVDRGKIEALFDRKPLPNSFSKFLFSFLSARAFLELN